MELAFALQQRMVLDNTNVTKDERARYIHQARSHTFSVTGYYFESQLDLPPWQKRGIGFYYDLVPKVSANPLRGEPVRVDRRVLKTDLQLPMGEGYDRLLRTLLIKQKEHDHKYYLIQTHRHQ